MSIVAVHSGAIATPRKNNATVKPATPITRSWTRIAATNPATTKAPADGNQQRTRDLQVPGTTQQIIGDDAAKHLGDHRAEQHRRKRTTTSSDRGRSFSVPWTASKSQTASPSNPDRNR